jgi:ABC-type antimicrobial peptide transport system permease subunit
MGFKTRTLLSRLQGMRTFFLFIDILLAAVGTVALVVAGLGIVNVLLISVLERTQEIGICKAIGASRGDVVVLFLTEAGIIGFIGGLCGLLLGRGIAWVLEAAANAFARSHGVTADLEIFSLPLWLLITSVAFACVVSVVAGFYPAVRASRVDPIEALRQ